MMTKPLTIYSYVKCGTCRKAINWLDENNIDYDLLDIIDNPPSKENILGAIKQLGNRKYLLNTSGKSYRSIGAETIKAMSDNEVLKLICSDSKLIKRPFAIDSRGKFFVGFSKSDWEILLKN